MGFLPPQLAPLANHNAPERWRQLTKAIGITGPRTLHHSARNRVILRRAVR